MPKAAVNPQGRVHLHLLASEMKASIDFYVTVLGFYYDRGNHEMAWLTREGMLLTLSPGEPAAQLSTYFGWSVGSINELEEYYASLKRRFQRLSAPPDPEQGRSYFFIYDPDDYPIAFTVNSLDSG